MYTKRLGGRVFAQLREGVRPFRYNRHARIARQRLQQRPNSRVGCGIEVIRQPAGHLRRNRHDPRHSSKLRQQTFRIVGETLRQALAGAPQVYGLAST